MTLTKEVIKDKLLAIRNQYNEYKMDFGIWINTHVAEKIKG